MDEMFFKNARLLSLLFLDAVPTADQVMAERNAMQEEGHQASDQLLRNMLLLASTRSAEQEDETLINRLTLSKLANIPDHAVAKLLIDEGIMEYQIKRRVGKIIPTEKGAAIAKVVGRQVLYHRDAALAFLAKTKL